MTNENHSGTHNCINCGDEIGSINMWCPSCGKRQDDKVWTGKKIYDKYFPDSTEHAVYSIDIRSENNEQYYTVELSDLAIQQILMVIAKDLRNE